MLLLAVLFVVFLFLGLRRRGASAVHALMVLAVAATLTIWYARMR